MATDITYLTPKQIQEKVALTRGQYMNYYGNSLPFNAELFLEREYGFQIIPVPKLRKMSVECSFCRGGKAILIDETDYSNPSKTNRLAFTFAHELGHKVLHEKYLPYASSISAADMEKIEILARLDGIISEDLTINACIEYKIQEIAAYFSVSVETMRIKIKHIDLSILLSGPYISRNDIANLKRISNNIKPSSKTMQSNATVIS